MNDLARHSADNAVFLADGGAVGALMRVQDWSVSPLGAPSSWPQSLRSVIGLLLSSKFPMFVAWGPELGFLYNDAYAEILGAKHPAALGRRFQDIWSEIWPDISPLIEAALSGQSSYHEDLPLVVNRKGFDELAWFTFSYSPVRDENGQVSGMYCAAVESTDRVLAERRRSFRLTFEERLRDLSGPKEIMSAALALTGEHLKLDRVGYTEIIDDAVVRMAGCFVANGMAPLTGEFPLGSFGENRIARQRQSITEVCDDVLADSQHDTDVWAAIDTRSFISVPLVRDGQLRASLYANCRNPRQWTTEDVALLEEVAARTRDAVERASAEQALRASEARLSFLDRLNAETLALAEADAVLATTTRLVGEHLGLSVCAYADVDEDGDGFTVRGDWAAPGATSIVGHYSLAAFGKLAVQNLSAGLPLVLNDTQRELPPEEAATYGSIGLAATVCMPLVKEGRLTALMAIHDKVPRVWTSEELALLREVTARSWAYVERVGATAELRESEAQFRAFAQAVPNHVWAASPDGALYWFNDQVYAYCGEAPGSLEGTKWARIVHPEDVPSATATWGHALATGDIYETEFRIRRTDGHYRWFLVRAEPVRAEDGAILNWVGTNTDIHDRRSAEQALRDLNETLEQRVTERTADRDRMWRLTTDIMLVARFDGTINAINPAWERLLGWSEEELVGRAFFDFVHPDDLAATAAEAGKLSEGVTTFRFENRYQAKDGSYRWLSWIAVPDEGLIHAVGRDITQERERQAELEQAQEALRQSQKMEAVGQLTGGLAHDFNNLLAGISGSLEVMGTRIAQGRLADTERYLVAAQGAAKRAAALTHRLLAFSRRQTLAPKVTDVNGLVIGMEDLIRRTVGPGIAVESALGASLWSVLVDAPQLENALLNLAINARDAMPDGGKLMIETANRWLDERSAKSRDLAPGQYVSLCITDNGTGMTPDVLAKAFDPFFTTKPTGLGTGLGLSMVYGFARQSGGQVRIHSEVGQGTTVCLYLPRHLGGEEEQEASSRGEASVPTGAGETVLVIDDEPVVRMLIVDVLKELGYGALEAGDGPEGLKVFQSKARVDLLITDVGLPGGLNGRQVADAARALRPDLKVLFITGYAENAVLNHGHLEHGMQVVTKPFVVDDLARRISDILKNV